MFDLRFLEGINESLITLKYYEVFLVIYWGLQQIFFKKKNPMFVYRWGQGTFKKLVLKKLKNGIFKKMGVGHPVKISTPSVCY